MIDLYYRFRTRDTYSYAVRLSILKKFYVWGKENCSQYFICDLLGSKIRCSFVDESDAMGFKLRWL